jgi:hypothetical protein
LSSLQQKVGLDCGLVAWQMTHCTKVDSEKKKKTSPSFGFSSFTLNQI